MKHHVFQLTAIVFSIAWCICVTYIFGRLANDVITFHYLYGLFIFSSLLGLSIWWAFGRSHIARCLSWGMAVLAGLLAAIGYVMFQYFQRSATIFNEIVVTAILQTYLSEASDFVSMQLHFTDVMVAATLLLCALLVRWGVVKAFHPKATTSELSSADYATFFQETGKLLIFLSKIRCFPVMISIVLLGLCVGSFLRWKPVYIYRQTSRIYHEQLRRFIRASQSNSIQISKGQKSNLPEPGKWLILVIGEATARDLMGVYGGPMNNTPWLEMFSRSDPGMTLFSNAYSNYTHTLQALSAALTDDRVYTGFNFPDVSTLIGEAQADGVHVTWISNNLRVSPVDSPITAFASQANEQIFIRENKELYKNSDFNDDALLIPVLKEKLSAASTDNRKHLFIVHLAGIHAPYNKNAPHDQDQYAPPQFSKREIGRLLNNATHTVETRYYLSSISYQDKVFSDLLGALEPYNNRPVSLLYLPDHGQDPTRGLWHDWQRFTWPMARIPMFAYLSPAWRTRYPERSQSLASHADAVFTNDLLFDLCLGQLAVHSPHYIDKYDLGSANYSVTIDSAMIREKKVSDDPLFRLSRRMKTIGNKDVLAVHRVDTLFKLKECQSLGIRRFEVDVQYSPNKDGGGDVLVGHDSETMADGLTLTDWLTTAMPRLDFAWLDTKNVTTDNMHEFELTLSRLDSLQSFRDRILVEVYYPEVAVYLKSKGWRASWFLGYSNIWKDNPDRCRAMAEAIDRLEIDNVGFPFEHTASVQEHILSMVKRPLTYYSFLFENEKKITYFSENLDEALGKLSGFEAVLVPLHSVYDL